MVVSIDIGVGYARHKESNQPVVALTIVNPTDGGIGEGNALHYPFIWLMLWLVHEKWKSGSITVRSKRASATCPYNIQNK